MKDFQTPQKEQARPSDLSTRRSKETPSKKSQKIPPKSLNAAFKTVSEDSSPENITWELPLDFSPISETFSNPLLSVSSEPLNLSDLSPSSTITVPKTDVTDLSLDCHQFFKPNCSKSASVEAVVLVNLLRDARSQVLSSADVDSKNKKVLDSMIKFVVDEFYTIHQDRDRVAELVSLKRRIVFMFFLISLLGVSVILFINSEPQRAFIRPLPT